MSRGDLERGLFRILRTLEAYRDELILVGGWVPYLHLRYGEPPAPQARTSLTAEADLVVPPELPPRDRPPVAGVLRQAGFRLLGPSGVVWARDPERGETVEFLRGHTGPALSRARAVAVEDQPGLRALSLDHLWIMETFTHEVLLPDPEGEVEPIPVRVPVLAAFVLNKANTYSLRGGSDATPKAGKDLLYLRDIMSAGEKVETSVRTELEGMLAHEARSKVGRILRRGVVHLERVSPELAGEAARILAERDGKTQTDARADVDGHLHDVLDLLADLRPG